MPEVAKIAILAVLQGLTEFFPVSSSGHLVIVKALLQLETPGGPTLEVVLHGGTLVSICVYYRRRLCELLAGVLRRDRPSCIYARNVLVACIPAALVYLFLGNVLESLFNRPAVAAAMLCVTGTFLLALRWAPLGNTAPGLASMFVMGIAQALALVPGISRSGATIAAGRWRGIEPGKAAELSFIMAIPLLFGAVVSRVGSILSGAAGTGLGMEGLITGFVISAATGYVALVLLVHVLSSTRFYWFGVYCLVAGVLALVTTLAIGA